MGAMWLIRVTLSHASLLPPHGPRFAVADVQVMSLAGVELKVLDPVVGPIAIPMMDAFFSSQLASEKLLHDDTMFHHEPLFDGAPDSYVAPLCKDPLSHSSILRDWPSMPGYVCDQRVQRNV